MVMLLLALNAIGQEQFFDDVYYSSNQSKEEASVEKNIKEEEKNDDLDAEPTETVSPSSYTRSDIEEERDVDEYNRRYSGYDDEAYAEEEEVAQEPEKTQVKVESDRRLIVVLIWNTVNVLFVIIRQVKYQLWELTRLIYIWKTVIMPMIMIRIILMGQRMCR